MPRPQGFAIPRVKKYKAAPRGFKSDTWIERVISKSIINKDQTMNTGVKTFLTKQNVGIFWFTYVVRISTSVDTPVRSEQLSDTFSRPL